MTETLPVIEITTLSGSQVRSLMRQYGWTVAKLAKALSVTADAVRGWCEDGYNDPATYPRFVRVIFEGPDPPPPPVGLPPVLKGQLLTWLDGRPERVVLALYEGAYWPLPASAVASPCVDPDDLSGVVTALVATGKTVGVC